jgi:purine-binding chemotaxis protein CheW
MDIQKPIKYEIPEEFVSGGIEFCIFRAGEKILNIPVDNLLEIAELTEIVPLPGSPDYLTGIAHYRGNAVPVLDIASIVGNERSSTPGKWLLVLKVGEELLGFSVMEMPDLGSVQEGESLDVVALFQKYRIK